MHTKLKVVSPVGEAVVQQRDLAPRLDTLEGKTVCEIWNAGFRGEVVFPIIEEMLRKRYPGVKVIPYTEFPLINLASMETAIREKTLEAVRARLMDKGCDAVITGNGA